MVVCCYCVIVVVCVLGGVVCSFFRSVCGFDCSLSLREVLFCLFWIVSYLRGCFEIWKEREIERESVREIEIERDWDRDWDRLRDKER